MIVDLDPLDLIPLSEDCKNRLATCHMLVYGSGDEFNILTVGEPMEWHLDPSKNQWDDFKITN